MSAPPTVSGRWSESEHAAFEQGLRLYGMNWKMIGSLVPTRTLVQIRTHAQKYFQKHAMPARIDGTTEVARVTGAFDQDEDAIARGSGGSMVNAGTIGLPKEPFGYLENTGVDPSAAASAGLVVRPVATMRHICLQPLHPTDQLGMKLRFNSATGFVEVDGFVPIPQPMPAAAAAAAGVQQGAEGESKSAAGGEAKAAAGGGAEEQGAMKVERAEGDSSSSSSATAPSGSAPLPSQLQVQMTTGPAERSDLVKVGDVILGISGVCTAGMDLSMVQQAIRSARNCTPGGGVVLHLSDSAVDPSFVEEVILHVANSAASLLGSRKVLDSIQRSVYSMLLAQRTGTMLPQLDGIGGSGSSIPPAPFARASDVAKQAVTLSSSLQGYGDRYASIPPGGIAGAGTVAGGTPAGATPAGSPASAAARLSGGMDIATIAAQAAAGLAGGAGAAGVGTAGGLAGGPAMLPAFLRQQGQQAGPLGYGMAGPAGIAGPGGAGVAGMGMMAPGVGAVGVGGMGMGRPGGAGAGGAAAGGPMAFHAGMPGMPGIPGYPFQPQQQQQMAGVIGGGRGPAVGGPGAFYPGGMNPMLAMQYQQLLQQQQQQQQGQLPGQH